MMQRRLILLLLGFIAVISAGCSNEDKKQPAPSQAKQESLLGVQIVRVKKENIPIWLEYTGKTEASQRIEVRARAAGRLEKVFCKEGEYVKKGQRLFEIEKAIYEASLEQAKAKLEGDLASLEQARADVERSVYLVKEGLAPRVILKQNEARAQELESIIVSDKARVKNAELNLEYTKVGAPISGRIGRMDIDVGNIVGFADKTLLTTIVSDDPMYAYFHPSEEQYQIMRQFRSKEILDAQVRVPRNIQRLFARENYTGAVDFSDSRVDRMTGRITMRAAVRNERHDLPEGIFVYVDVFITDQRPFLMIPPSVVMEDQFGSYVYLVDAEDTVKRADIERGYEGRDYLIVTKGLNDGDKVIISGLTKLRPELKVSPKDVTETKGIMTIMGTKRRVLEKE